MVASLKLISNKNTSLCLGYRGVITPNGQLKDASVACELHLFLGKNKWKHQQKLSRLSFSRLLFFPTTLVPARHIRNYSDGLEPRGSATGATKQRRGDEGSWLLTITDYKRTSAEALSDFGVLYFIPKGENIFS